MAVYEGKGGWVNFKTPTPTVIPPSTPPAPLPVEQTNNVAHPLHYTSHPSGVECIQVTEHMGFNLGNVIKYVWRADLKGETVEDLQKAKWYLEREIQRRRNGQQD